MDRDFNPRAHCRWPAMILAALAASAAACGVDLELADDVRIECRSAADCPGKMSCNGRDGEAGHCVAAGGDTTAPGVVDGSAALVIDVPAGCPLSAVSALQPGGTATLTFATRREQREAPTVVARQGDTEIGFGLLGESGDEYTFVIAVPSDAAPGPYEVVARLVEPLDSAEVTLDLDPVMRVAALPAPLDGAALAALVYRRLPWGAASTGLAPEMRIIAPAGTLPVDLRVWFRDASTLGSPVLTVARADGDGGLDTLLPLTEATEVTVTAADDACQVIPFAGTQDDAARILNVEWVANAGADGAGPLRARRAPYLRSILHQGTPPAAGGAGALAAADGTAVTVDGAGHWQPLVAGDAPPRALQAKAAWDSARGRVVLFGGYGHIGDTPMSTAFDDTWEWDGFVWHHVEPALLPHPRLLHVMAYDAAGQRTLVFGGYGTAQVDGTCPDGSAAVENGYPCMYGDSWTWDGEQWLEVTTDPSPPQRLAAGMAYDSVRGRMVLFGGVDNQIAGRSCPDGSEPAGGFCFFDDLWEWDGKAWAELSPAAGPSPASRAHPRLAYDVVRGEIILYGGLNLSDYPSCPGGITVSQACAMADTWAWDGEAWTELDSPDLAPAAPRPGPRSGHGLVWDASRKRVLLHGGYDITGACSGWITTDCADTWTWDGAAWSELTTSAGPNGRSDFVFVAMGTSGSHLLFGGYFNDLSPANPCPTGSVNFLDGCITDETWRLTGDAWQRPAPSPRPSGRSRAAFARIEPEGSVVAFGGAIDAGAPGAPCSDGGVADSYGTCSSAETWTWDGTIWSREIPTSAPSPRQLSLLVATGEGSALLWGGVYFRGADCLPDGVPNESRPGDCLFPETWMWDGSDWSVPATTAQPPAPWLAAAAYDPVRDQVVLFGGIDGELAGDRLIVYGETWIWTAADDWEQRTPTSSPAARFSHAMTYDAGRGEIVMYGGGDNDYDFDETWVWDGDDWALAANDGPGGLVSHAMTYDPASDRVVLFGGVTWAAMSDETWLWDGIAWRRANVDEPPAKRIHHGLVTGPHGPLLFGGRGVNANRDDAARWDAGEEASAGLLLHVDFAAAGADPGAAITSVAVAATAGGVGYPEDTTREGSVLEAWEAGRWSKLDANDAPPGAPASLSWSSDVATAWTNLEAAEREARLGRLFGGATRDLGLLLHPEAPNGPRGGERYGQLAVDHVEVTVRYRLPGSP